MARRLAQFAWGQVEHDVTKMLYESVISASERARLGKYYTLDWHAEEIVGQVVTDPIKPSRARTRLWFHDGRLLS